MKPRFLLTNRLALLATVATIVFTATPIHAGILFTESFETPDITGYVQGTTPATNWVRAAQGFNSSYHGLIDQEVDGAGGLAFTAPSTQGYAFRYTNSGLTTAAGKIAALQWGVTYTVSVDVVKDIVGATGLPYTIQLIAIAPGAARDDCRATPTGSTILNSAAGNAPAGGTVQTITFNFTPNPVTHAAIAGYDLGVRFIGASDSANIDNVQVSATDPPIAYWDINGTTSGAGGPAATGTWDGTAANWNPAADGTGTSAAWATGQAIFAAGTDASGPYTVTVDGSRDINLLAFEEGTVTLANGASGALNLTGDTPVTVASGLSATIAPPITEDAAGRQFIKLGAGTLTLAGNSSYTGATTVVQGTLLLSGTDNSAATGGMTLNGGLTRFNTLASINGTTRNVTLNAGATLAFEPAFGITDIPTALSTRIVAASAGTIAADNYAATNFDFNTPTLTAARLGALGNVSYSGTLTPEGTTYRLGGGGGTLTMANANALTGTGYSAVISGNVTLPLANNLDGNVTLNSGLLKIGTNGSLGSGTLVINGGRISSTDTTARTLANALDVNANMALGDATNTGILTFSSGVDITGGTRTFTTNSDVEFTGIVSGASALTKAGTGVLTLSGDNTYNGTTTVDAGTLVLSGSNSSAGATTLNGATLQLDSDSNGGLASGLLTISQNAGVLQAINADRVIANNVSLNSSPTISGSQSLTINGTMTLNNNRTLTNSISGSGKLLTIASITRDGTNNRNLTVAGAGNTTVTGGVALGTGTLTKSDAGTLTLRGANSYTGATAVNTGGTLALVGGSQDSVITVNSGAFLGFTLGSPTTSTKALNLNTGHAIRITGAPTLGSYTLITAASIGGTGTPTLEAPISGYELVVDGTSLKLNSTGGGSTYDTWAASKGLTGASGSATDPAKDADPDKDGSNNLSEFAFNGDPLSGSDNGKVYVLTEDSDFAGDPTSAKELILTIAVRTGTPVFAGSPSPSATQATDGITYRIEGSLDLASFPTTVNVVPTPVIIGLPVNPGTGYEYRSFSLAGSDGLSGKGFLRAKVTSP